MEESGETKILYKEFKQNLDIAREARVSLYISTGSCIFANVSSSLSDLRMGVAESPEWMRPVWQPGRSFSRRPYFLVIRSLLYHSPLVGQVLDLG